MFSNLISGLFGAAKDAAIDAAKHHDHDRPATIDGEQVVVREKVKDAWGHVQEQQIVGGRFDGISSGDQKGKHSYQARERGMDVLESKVQQAKESEIPGREQD